MAGRRGGRAGGRTGHWRQERTGRWTGPGRLPAHVGGHRAGGYAGAAARIGGGVAVAAAVAVRVATGGASVMWHRWGAGAVLPPLWVLSLLWLGGFFAVGATVGGLVLAPRRGPAWEAAMWRGCTCLIVSLGGALMWYALLFEKGTAVLSWLCLPVAAAAAVAGGMAWQRVDRRGALIAYGWAIWLALLFCAQGAVMLHN